MIIFLECATIVDNVNFFAEADKSRLRPDELALLKECAQIRAELKPYTTMDVLVGKVRDGENIMLKKVLIDKYHKAQVDLLKLFVKLNQPCKFSYLSVYGNQGNTCDNLTVKEQMALEMIMSRLSSSAIYHLGAFSSIAGLLEITEASYDPKFKGLATLNNHIQVALSYFKEAYLPLLRFSRVFPWVEKLMTGQSASITDARKDIFDVNKLLVECNIGYLMLEKLRVLGENRKCKEGARNIHDKLLDCKQILSKYSGGVRNSIRDYLECAMIFFKAYTLMHHLKDNEKRKNEEDYGFVKKEFKVMIMENLEAANHIVALGEQLKKLNQSSDCYEFARLLFDKVFVKYAQLCNYIFSVKTENSDPMYQKVAKPSIESIWSGIGSYNLIDDLALTE